MRITARLFLLITIIFSLSCKKATTNTQETLQENQESKENTQINSIVGDTIEIDTAGNAIDVKEAEVAPEIIEPAKPTYSLSMIENKVSGFVTMKLLVGTDGRVKRYILLQDLGHGTAEAIHKALFSMKFTAARKNKKRVAVWIQTTMNFTLPKLNF